MRKRSKTYRPKPVDSTSWSRALSLQGTLDADQLRDLGLAYRAALANVMGGWAKEGDLHTLACSLNIGLVMAERGLGKEFEQDFINAHLAVVRAMERFKRTGKVGLDGEGITAIKAAFEVYDQQLELPQAGFVKACLEEVRRRAVSGEIFEVEA